MVEFQTWCSAIDSLVDGHSLRVIRGTPANLNIGIAAVAGAIPTHYDTETKIAQALVLLGKPAAAAFITDKLPTTKQIRSGDLGEILATEYIPAFMPYSVPIKRLRWKDHRNMAMRGDDVIGILLDPVGRPPQFLKAEVKSRARLAPGIVAEARATLDKDGGQPSAHSLSFVSSRLSEQGNHALADAIVVAQYRDGIAPQQVRHLLFTFSGNDPTDYLMAPLTTYGGAIAQSCVGVRIDNHGEFISNVYDLVIANANQP